MRILDILKAMLLFVFILLAGMGTAVLIQRLQVLDLQKELLQYDRKTKQIEVRIRQRQLEIKQIQADVEKIRWEAWLKAYTKGEYINEGDIK